MIPATTSLLLRIRCSMEELTVQVPLGISHMASAASCKSQMPAPPQGAGHAVHTTPNAHQRHDENLTPGQ